MQGRGRGQVRLGWRLAAVNEEHELGLVGGLRPDGRKLRGTHSVAVGWVPT